MAHNINLVLDLVLVVGFAYKAVRNKTVVDAVCSVLWIVCLILNLMG